MNLRDRHAHKPFGQRLASQQGLGLMEIIVVVAAVVLIAAILVPTVFNWVEEGKIAKAHGDAKALAAAMSRFFQDTGRWPGQAEILKSGSSVRFLIVGSPSKASFPSWIVSGGPNQTLQTSFNATKLNPDADDVGVSLGKLTTRK